MKVVFENTVENNYKSEIAMKIRVTEITINNQFVIITVFPHDLSFARFNHSCENWYPFLLPDFTQALQRRTEYWVWNKPFQIQQQFRQAQVYELLDIYQCALFPNIVVIAEQKICSYTILNEIKQLLQLQHIIPTFCGVRSLLIVIICNAPSVSGKLYFFTGCYVWYHTHTMHHHAMCLMAHLKFTVRMPSLNLYER